MEEEDLISNHEKCFLIDGLQQQTGIRNDGRSPTDYRSISAETGVLSGSNGSARVRIGSTDVLVSVKAEITSLEKGDPVVNRLKFFVDISANASPKFSGRGGNEMAEEMAKALYTAYDNDSVLPDMGRLILAPTHVWTVHVDALLLQHDGNPMDAISLGVKAALFDTQMCNVVVRPADEGKVIIDLPEEASSWRFDVSRAPLVVAVNQVGGQCLFDADLKEELCSTSTLWIGVQPTAGGKEDLEDNGKQQQQPLVTCIKKTKGGSLEVDSMNEMLCMAAMVARKLDSALMRRLKSLDGKDGEHVRQQFMRSFYF